MKLISFVCLIVLLCSSFSEEIKQAMPLPDFDNVKVARAEQLLRSMATIEWEKTFHYDDFVRAVLASKRLDVARVCFQYQLTCNLIVEQAGAMEDSPFRDLLALVMLRTQSLYWPNEESLVTDKESIIGPHIYVPLFRDVLAKYDTGMLSYSNELSLERRKSRMIVADKLELAMRSAGVVIPEAAMVVPSSVQSEKSEATVSKTRGQMATDMAVLPGGSQKPDKADVADDGIGAMLLVAGVSVAALFLTLRSWLRRKSVRVL